MNEIRPSGGGLFLKGEPIEGEVAVITQRAGGGGRLQPESESGGWDATNSTEVGSVT